MQKYLIVIAGPTAVGKTAFCIQLAQYLKTEIISADARQFYQEMIIGTAQPSPIQLKQVRHHFINFLTIHQAFSAGMFENEALSLIKNLFEQHNHIIVTGGSGLYLRALCQGLAIMPTIPPSLRTALKKRYEVEGLAVLTKELALRDPAYHEIVDLQNPQRILRALEVCIASGRPYTEARMGTTTPHRPFKVIKIGLYLERDVLYERINSRVNEMLKQGFLKEANQLYNYKNLQVLQTIGYQELFKYFEQKYTLEEAILLIQRNTRRYAKRQMTWFRKEKDIAWFHATNFSGVLDYLKAKII